MGRAGGRGADDEILRNHRDLRVRHENYAYRVWREGDQSSYSVTDGKDTITLPIPWALGLGEAGQTYVLERGGNYYESRVSFYNDIQGLDVTLGATSSPMNLDEAVGRRLDPEEIRKCFSCHNTRAVTSNRVDLARLIPGVTCEACHGPGAAHVAAMKAGKLHEASIFNPGKLSPDAQVEFCGACHRTWLDVQTMRARGVNNVRFQPYRLVNSRCWFPEDARISCRPCHDPHDSSRHEVGFYDSKCLACHVSKTESRPSSDRPGPACPVRARECVTCHMPKYELPGGHYKFTDHWIRVVRPGEAYPN